MCGGFSSKERLIFGASWTNRNSLPIDCSWHSFLEMRASILEGYKILLTDVNKLC